MNHDEMRPVQAASHLQSVTVGVTTEGLGDFLVRQGKLEDSQAFARVRDDAVSIIRRCHPFGGPNGRTTGLVVGYVQSGKTMSMTTVSALARDNGCRIIVLLAGVTKNLLRQTARRFKKQLREASGTGSAWKILNSEDGIRHATDVAGLRTAVAEWRDADFDESDRQTYLLVVLKNHSHLKRVDELLEAVDLSGIPAIVLDDEADQAGLNTRPDDDPSTTHRWIRSLRSRLPHHTYLQYTATPQAPLLISLDDALSPAFAELVRPGDGYTGGQAFFGAGSGPHRVQPIPADDLFKPGSPPDAPPPSLLKALRVFCVACAVARKRSGPRPRSMLVHPSQRQTDHQRYVDWILQVQRRWSQSLSGSEDEKAEIVDELREGYDELAKTSGDLPPFEELIRPLRTSLGRLVINEVNSKDGSEIDWDNADEFVLVGGEKLNRGYTVEGLIVTYMPRDAGGWNADTLQQRARFFGYKRGCFDLVRVYLHPSVIDAFRNYVEHEESVRSQLAEHRGQPLRVWRRAFFLDSKLKPTRRNVLSDPYYRRKERHVWFRPGYPHEVDQDSRERLEQRIVEACATWTFEVTSDDTWGKHTEAVTTLRDVMDKLLVEYPVAGADIPSWYGDLVVLSDLVADDPERTVLVVRMDDFGRRVRTPSSRGVVNPFQGRSANYPGDDKICASNMITVQLHNLRVNTESVPMMAVRIPRALRSDVLVQPQE